MRNYLARPYRSCPLRWFIRRRWSIQRSREKVNRLLVLAGDTVSIGRSDFAAVRVEQAQPETSRTSRLDLARIRQFRRTTERPLAGDEGSSRRANLPLARSPASLNKYFGPFFGLQFSLSVSLVVGRLCPLDRTSATKDRASSDTSTTNSRCSLLHFLTFPDTCDAIFFYKKRLFHLVDRVFSPPPPTSFSRCPFSHLSCSLIIVSHPRQLVIDQLCFYSSPPTARTSATPTPALCTGHWIDIFLYLINIYLFIYYYLIKRHLMFSLF